MTTIGKGRAAGASYRSLAPSLLLTLLLCITLALGLGAAAPAMALNLGGAVVLDANANGIVDATDTTVPGIQVSVQPAAGGVAATVVTGADGRYTFPGLAANTYIVTVGSSPGVLNETPAAVTVSLAADRSDINFLFVIPGLIGGRAILDQNGNGVGDSGELGIPNVQVQLQRLNAQGGFDLVTTVSTSSDGSFFFPVQPAGTYRVVETDLAGYLSTGATAGASGTGVVVDANTIRIVLNGAQSAAGLQFLDRTTQPSGGGGAISGFVYDDTNGNGSIDPPADQPVANAVVELRDAAQNLLASTLTDATGQYSFSSVVSGGTYVVRVIPPAGSVLKRVSPTAPAKAAGTAGILIQPFVPGTTYANNNFLVGVGTAVSPEVPGSANAISGKVFNDLDGNGRVSGGEVGLAGATLTLVSSTGVSFGTTTTNGSGEFTFVNLPAGDYTLTETDPLGFVSTGVQPGVGGTSLSVNSIRITVTGTNNLYSGQIFLDTSTTPVPPNNLAQISGSVFADQNGNNFIDFADTPLSNVLVVLQNQFGGFVTQAFTNVNGAYSFAGLQPGTYRVVQTVPANYFSVTAFAGNGGFVLNSTTIQVTVPANGSSVGNNFLDRSTQVSPTGGSVSGTVWQDLDGNNVIDGLDSTLAGVTVRLFVLGQNNPAFTTTTAANGAYLFPTVPPGTYLIQEVNPPNFVSVNAFAGINGIVINADVIQVGVVTGVNSGNNNFLDRSTQVSPTVGSLSGTVFQDANGNLALDGADTRLAGATVQLFVLGQNSPLFTTTTGANGVYTFSLLPPGTYRVVQTPPANFSPVAAVAGPNGIVVTSTTIQVTVFAGFDSGGNNFLDRANVGPTGPNTISGFAIRDLDTNGIPSNEPGLAGMTVVLRDAFNTFVASRITDTTGAFSFSGLPNGSYTLTATPPANLFSTNAIAGQGGTRLSAASIGVTTSFGVTNYAGQLFLAGP